MTDSNVVLLNFNQIFSEWLEFLLSIIAQGFSEAHKQLILGVFDGFIADLYASFDIDSVSSTRGNFSIIFKNFSN
jgi:hypothetical protein